MRVKSRHHIRTVVGLATFALLTTSCRQDGPLNWIQARGPIAKEIGGLWNVVFWAAVAVFFLVEGLIVIALFRFRQRKGDTSMPVQTHGNTRLELGWTIAPALILVALAFPTLGTIWSLAREKPDSLHITVTAHQWWWQYDYAKEKIATANELHIPTGRPVLLTLKSADIIHSYWVPKLAGKQDVVPTMTNHLTIEASDPGEYFGTCVEFCGLSHANMRLRVFAHSPADYAKWVAGQQALPAESTGLAAKGKAVFLGQQCVSCHTINGTKANATVGPNLTHFASRTSFAGSIFDRNPDNLRAWLTDAPKEKPGSKMPAGVATMGLSQDDITALIAYLQSLR